MDGKTARGASSPANPALTRPEPLSHTRAVVSSSSHMFGLFWAGLLYETEDGKTGKTLVHDVHRSILSGSGASI